MPASLRRLPLLLLLSASLPAVAQREGDGPPAQDPFGRRETPVPVRAIGNYRSHAYQNGILSIRSTDGSTLRLRPWAAGVLRVEYFPAGAALQPDSSVSVVQAPLRDLPADACNPGCDGPPSPARVARFGNLICQGIFATPTDLTWNLGCSGIVTIQKNPLRVRYQSADGLEIAEAGGAFQQLGTAGGTGVSFRLSPDEHLYGTGSRALPLDRRGRRLTLYNEAHYSYQNGEPTLNVTLPTVVSSRGYMLFFDHHTAATLDLGATDKNVLEYRGEGLQNLGYFIVSGDSYAEILSRYTALTGRQPLPPRWGMGLIQSRFGYKSEPEMYQVARRMRQAGFPLDGLVLDLYWFGGTKQQGDFQWVQPNFPDPRRMMRRLDSAGVKTLLISEPYVMRTSRNDALVRRQQLVGRGLNGQPYTVESFWAGPATLLDMFRPAARQWMWQQYDRLKQDGVGGWWCDLGEPENQPADMVYDLGPTRRIHNAYGQAWSSILSENYARQYPQERLFNLARSGWAGMQRHSVFPWSGDVNRSWSGYQAQVPIMLSMGLGGVGYMHSDAGGFCVGPVDPELYTRWLQMASLGPILRPHGEGVPPEPYWYPERYQASVRSYARLRYQLLPYLYSLAWENSQTGTPLTRPMNYGTTYPKFELTLGGVLPGSSDFIGWGSQPEGLSAEERAAGFTEADVDGWGAPHTAYATDFTFSRNNFRQSSSPTLSNVNDQFFLGPNLLVAPVLHPGQRRRNVVLPAGNWVDFLSHETLPGNRTIGRPAPLTHLPLLVRAGAILPMTAYVPSTAQYRTDTLRVRYYADATVPSSSFVQYEDDGRTANAHASGAYQTISYLGQTAPAATALTVQLQGPGYAGAPAQRTVELLIPRVATAPPAVLLGGTALPAAAWKYHAEAHILQVFFPLSAEATTVSVPGLRLDATPSRYADPDPVTLEAPANRTFSGRVELRYTLHQPGQNGPLRIVDGQGRLVRTLPTASTAGAHTLAWSATDAQNAPLPGGVYWAELAGQRQRLVLLPQ
ncbi:TIM-barrel domain-containing protein [Hymenobacter sp. B81]|uniref:TIM-barrel domain-containing protein n=1 Tax=Hymenobacter sp. B81 TaxID=3344878 RepID=UPI0037DC95C5